MELAMVGLGKMGGNMTKRLLQNDHRVVAFDLEKEAIQAAAEEGAVGVYDWKDLTEKLTTPRAIWVMVPSGQATEQTIDKLGEVLNVGDIVIDGGNNNYQDSMRRAEKLKKRGLHFVDVGTSGGVWGLIEGYSMMIGGEKEVVEHLQPVFETLAPEPDQGWGHVGPIGAGHFVKMIHNGIEYGLMQAIAEGFELMEHKKEFGLDLHQVAEIWRYGSVIRSWLLDLTARALEENPTLDGVAAFVQDSGEGRWTVAEAIELNCAIPVITMALERRFRSREEAPFGDKLVAALRDQFGGHGVTQTS